MFDLSVDSMAIQSQNNVSVQLIYLNTSHISMYEYFVGIKHRTKNVWH